MTNNLLAELARIQGEHRAAAEDIFGRHALAVAEMQKIATQIAELEKEINSLGERSDELSREGEANDLARAKRMAACVTSHLDNQQDALARWVEAGDVASRIAALEEAVPDIAQRHAEYIDFDADLERNLASLPEFYRTKMLDSHAELKAKVGPYAELLSQRDALTDPGIPRLFAPAHLSEGGELTVVLPLRASGERARGERSENTALRLASDAVTDWIRALPKELHWSIVEIEPGEWRLWYAVRALVTTGDDAATCDALAQGIELVGSLKSSLVDHSGEMSLVPVDAATWALLESAKEIPAASKAKPAASPRKLAFAGNAWFTTEDWLGWKRGSKRGRGRRWRQEGLALQTLFVRMVAQGAVGDHHISLAGVSDGLPDDDAQALRSVFGRARYASIVTAQKVDDGRSYAISPDHLDDVRDLINGIANETWEAVLAQA